MTLPPAQRFTDHIHRVPSRGYLSLNNCGNGDWIYRQGHWSGKVNGHGYSVQVTTWTGPRGQDTLLLEFTHGRQFNRRWNEAPSDKTISRRCRAFVSDVLDGRIGAVGLNAR